MDAINNVKIGVTVEAGNSAATLGGISDSVDRVNSSAGKAKSGFNSLSNSINQLTREMPAFANSLNTGFMAISNNLPMLIDEINKLKIANKELAATGQPTKSVFGQLAASLFSFQTLMSVGITLLTVYGSKIVEWAGNLIKGKNTTDEFVLNIKTVNKALGESSVANSIGEYKLLTEQVKLAANGFGDKDKILKLYNDTLGKTFGNSKNINEVEKLLVDNAPVYIKSVKQKAIATEAFNEYARLSIDKQRIISETQAEFDKKVIDENLKYGTRAYAQADNQRAAKQKQLLGDINQSISIYESIGNKALGELSTLSFKTLDTTIKTEKAKTKVIEDESKKRNDILKEENNKRLEEILKLENIINNKTKMTSDIISTYIKENNLSLTSGQIKYLEDLKDKVLDFNKKSEEITIQNLKNRGLFLLSSNNEIKSTKEYNDELEKVQKTLELQYEKYFDLNKIGLEQQKLYTEQPKVPFLPENIFIPMTNIDVIKERQKNAETELRIDLEKFMQLKTNEEDFNKFIVASAEERAKILLDISKRNKDDIKEQNDNFKSSINQTASDLGSLFSQISANQKQGTQAQKEFAIASIVASEGVALANAIASAFSPSNPDNLLTGGVSGSLKAIGFAAQIGLMFAKIDNILSSGNAQENVMINQNLQPRRKFASGGILSGPSHNQGGIKTPFGELEGGEIVLNKNVSQNKAARTIASKLNKQMGGSDFSSTGGDVIKVELANPQYIQARVTDKILSKSF